MKNNISILKSDRCTACSSCYNTCSFQALTMQEGKDGFIYPYIDSQKCTECGMCVKACPVLNLSQKNQSSPKLFAARSTDEIREKSSSGGMFTVLAEKILSLGGSVCGAAFDSEMNLQHILINQHNQLTKLCGSKYVQSDIGLSYRKIEKLLKADSYVLFTGTPCQCAALRSYLRKDYEKLFIIDLLCHGVPSQRVFKKYLSEISKGKKVVDVKFRDKRFGWTAEHIAVNFSDGTEYTGTKETDVYLKGFFRNLILRESCGECPFSEFPRQGDISVGDFWGISKIDKTQNDGKGTSLVYVNTDKGMKLFKMIENQLTVKEFDFSTTEIRNRINKYYPINTNRYSFFKFMENGRTTFSASVKNALTRHFDIGLVSNYYAGNFGGSLTQYALYNVLEDMGYSCLMIERPEDATDKASLETVKKIYLELPYPQAAIAKPRKTKAEMSDLNKHCDTFIVGSDQLFQYALFNDLGRFVTLDWVDNDKKKIAYAASYGHDYIWGDKKVLAEMGYYMRKFDAFSVREESGVKISKSEFGVNAEWVLDPVFLCETKHYDQLIKKSKRKFPKHYIGSYILDPTEDKANIIKKVQKALGLKAKIVSELSHNSEYEEPLKELDVEHMKIEERLQLIKNCDFFVTDSFHGTCFAIIMGKPFISILNKNRGGSRFKSLLSLFGLNNRLIVDSHDIDSNTEIFNVIDYTKINTILDKERTRCLNWLKNAITSEKKLVYSDYDILMKLIDEQRKEIADLKAQIKLLSEGDMLLLRRIRTVSEYVHKLVEVNKDYIIAIAVKDTPGLSVNEEIAKELQSIGLSTNIMDKHWQSYATVINKGQVEFEQLASENIKAEKKIDNLSIAIQSANLKAGNIAQIKVNGKDYAVNKRGLNIVVIDRESGNIVDSVCLDMHLKQYQLYRK